MTWSPLPSDGDWAQWNRHTVHIQCFKAYPAAGVSQLGCSVSIMIIEMLCQRYNGFTKHRCSAPLHASPPSRGVQKSPLPRSPLLTQMIDERGQRGKQTAMWWSTSGSSQAPSSPFKPSRPLTCLEPRWSLEERGGWRILHTTLRGAISKTGVLTGGQRWKPVLLPFR